MRIVKAIFGGAFLIFAIGCLVNLVILLTNKAPDAMTGGAIAASTIKWSVLLVLFGGAAFYFLWSVFRRPRLVTPVKPQL